MIGQEVLLALGMHAQHQEHRHILGTLKRYVISSFDFHGLLSPLG
jgi:hypothetical protein